MRIAVFGGSFDPIHTGHAMVASYAVQQGMADEVWLMVSRRNPMKTYSTFASEEHRLRMAKIVAEKVPGLRASGYELNRPAPSYTIDTLQGLRHDYPQHDFRIIIGADSLLNFSGWKSSQSILKDFGVIVYPRPGFPLPDSLPEGMVPLNGVPECGISSTFIRERIRAGWNIDFFVPVDVAEYIRQNNLYEKR